MAKKKQQTPEDIARLVQEGLDREKAELQKYVRLGYIPSDATRSFEIGQRVEMGAHDHVVIAEKDETGALYLLHLKYDREGDGIRRTEFVDKKMWRPWMDIFPYRTNKDWKDIPKFTQTEEMRLQFYQTSLSSFDSIVYHFGLDLNPDYQRGHVWTMEDKVKLIDSIFKGVDIGKFVFIRRDYGTDEHLYEILDGKQRLTAIMEFREDRFRYNGLLYSELHPHDQSHIEFYSIATADVSNPTKEQIYNYFLKLNTGGKPMDVAQLEKVAKLLEEEKKKKG
jgi:hypothetical protein